MDRALFHADNAYYWPNYHAVGMLMMLDADDVRCR